MVLVPYGCDLFEFLELGVGWRIKARRGPEIGAICHLNVKENLGAIASVIRRVLESRGTFSMSECKWPYH